MFCESCGVQAEDPKAVFCAACGAALRAGGLEDKGRPAASDAERALRVLLPVNRNIVAVAAGYAGLFCLVVLPGPVALGLGIAALVQLKRRPEQWGRGRAWFGVIAGGLATGLLLVITVAKLLG